MKTTLRNIAMTIGLTAVLGSATMMAQSSNHSKATIPFDFQLKKTTLPAGSYSVKLNSESKMLVFQNLENGHTAMVLAYQLKSGIIADPKLVFRYDGERYTMDEVRFGNGVFGALKGKGDLGESERGIAATVRLVTK